MSGLKSGSRHLLLLRHADAVDGGCELADLDRPLSPRGRRQAAFVAKRLAGVPVDYVLCSPSTRTRETAEPLLAARCPVMPTVVYDRRLYESNARTVLGLIRGLPDSARSVLVIGHNPWIAELLDLLAPDREGMPDGFKKGACFHLAADVPWASVEDGSLRVAGYLRGE
jgi:phosphohistidine phosphatase